MPTVGLLLALAVGANPWGFGNAHGIVPALAPNVAASVKAATALVLVRGATGSAFVVGTYRGRVLLITNAHVLVPPRGMQPWGERVVFDAGTASESPRVTAEVLGRDEKADLALLAVPAQTRLRPSLSIASRCEELPQLPVYVAGFPFGLDLAPGSRTPSVTLNPGRISGRHETNGLLEPDVGINPGNSGGPIVTMDGIVLGVAVAHVSRSEQSYAIPCGAIRRVVERWVPGFELDVRPLPPLPMVSNPSPAAAVPPVAPSSERKRLAHPEEMAGIASLMGSGGRGTGVVVSRRGDALVLATADTAMFRVMHGSTVEVWFQGDVKPRQGKYMGMASGLALVEVPRAATPLRHPFGFSARLPRETERVFVVGFNPTSLERDFDLQLENGNLSGFREEDGGKLLQLDFGVDGGVLGGLVLDEAGKNIAIARRRAIGTNICIAIPGELVERAARTSCFPGAEAAIRRTPKPVPPNVEAQYQRGVSHYFGDPGFTKSVAAAMKEFEPACAANHGGACQALATIYANGRDVAFDYDRALSYTRRGCALGTGCKELWDNFGDCPK
jgi:S1-C subfamily serine protease